MNLSFTIINIFLAASLAFQGWLIPGPARQNSAEWCQCVIFVLNILGIKQIPGEYWTAASLAEPDQAGKTWMDYEGYTQRAGDDMPQTGDLLVLSSGAEVVTVQTWDGSEHLVPVLVDVWAGHLGIVLNAEPVQKEGTNYFQVHLLSANWGVSSHSLGVVGSCFNVDESSFLLPVAYEKAAFFYASDPVKTRERMVNRAKRWALFGLAVNSQSSLDGFPITPSGFISHVLEPIGEKPITPVITDIQNTLLEILPTGALPGDILVFGEEKNPGLGVITRIASGNFGDDVISLDVISMEPGKKVMGPDTWQVIKETGGWLVVDSDQNSTAVRFFRYMAIPGYPALQEIILTARNDNGNEYQATLIITNGGGEELALHDIELIAYPVTIEGKVDTIAGIHVPMTDELTMKPGEIHSLTFTIRLVDNGQYRFELYSNEFEKPFWLEDLEKSSVIIK